MARGDAKMARTLSFLHRFSCHFGEGKTDTASSVYSPPFTEDERVKKSKKPVLGSSREEGLICFFWAGSRSFDIIFQ